MDLGEPRRLVDVPEDEPLPLPQPERAPEQPATPEPEPERVPAER